MGRLIDADEETKWANENLPDAHAGVITCFLRLRHHRPRSCCWCVLLWRVQIFISPQKWEIGMWFIRVCNFYWTSIIC